MLKRPQAAVRPATPADVPALALLLAELFAIEADFEVDPKRQCRGLQQLLQEPERAALWVAAAEDRVVGMISVQVLVSTAEGGPVGLVEDLVVAEGWRGQGIGSLLLGAAEGWSRERGLLRLQLLADRDNQAGLTFYRARRWVQTRLLCLRRGPG